MPRERAPAVATLDRVLKQRTAEGALYEKMDGGKVRCFACGHRCAILPGHDGVCRVRFNRDGTLFVPRGYVAGLQVDPIEKKPFFHAFPGAVALSFGMLGCDLHCAYCQNWLTSQALRDPVAVAPPNDITAEEIVRIAVEKQAPAMVSTYNEPLITAEWAVEVFRLARQEKITCGFVSNGNATPEVLEFLRPWVDLYKVDLKSFRDKQYRSLGGKLETILETIRNLHRLGFWVEIVTLVVPGFNDSEAELGDMARFLAGISPDIPWHCTAFHEDYRMSGSGNTRVRQLIRACELGAEAGLRYCYAGNIPGSVGNWENTYCPTCRKLLIERSGYRIRRYELENGRCPGCKTAIAGFWGHDWKVPEKDGGLPGRVPRAIDVRPAADLPEELEHASARGRSERAARKLGA
ncbi:MAG: AmmeMemoRadiSam system radical SAM enzyme [Candidatus Wallbacteria bacterium]|nr:AmmeMemoRadiSam system radical SAM enzyme [Candidatus Wallbacteria bacterium]